MAEAGFPLWITEMTLNEADVTTKAQGIEDVMTLYFSHNMVKGVLLWGFWSEAIWRPDAALATGTDSITLNAAGQKYIDLVNTRWRTNWSGKLKTYRNERYFKGDYSIKVKKSGVTLKTVKVNLPSKSKIIIRVKGTNASPKVIFRIR
ncbi:anti-sigma-I factor RsgI6-like [Argopecten irradians]|uniref:anti-sigma-I factor RsgI6-like n=1 Tax=Argopecten irradians TaxID=31199 RepID=UPI00371E9747